MRLDSYLAQYFPEHSRAYWQKRCRVGQILVNGKPEKPSFLMGEDDEVKVLDTDPTSDQLEMKLPVLYEDVDVIVFDKPAGMLTHSKGAFNPEQTVASYMKDRFYPDDSSDRTGIVHRLDRGTSGVIVCAKNDASLKFLQRQFSDRKAKKTYVAVVGGSPKQDELVLQWPIQRNPKRPQTFRVHAQGKAAETYLKVLRRGKNAALLELQPKTGRTHQLRVHLAKLGHPIIGDKFYGGKEHDRMLLHAQQLELTLPSGKLETFASAMPFAFVEYIDKS